MMKMGVLSFFIFGNVVLNFHLLTENIFVFFIMLAFYLLFQYYKTGKFWFGTRGDLSVYDGKTFTHFSIKEGLSHGIVYCIAEDSKNYLWTGGARGACRLNRATDAFEKVYYTSGKNNFKQLSNI